MLRRLCTISRAQHLQGILVRKAHLIAPYTTGKSLFDYIEQDSAGEVEIKSDAWADVDEVDNIHERDVANTQPGQELELEGLTTSATPNNDELEGIITLGSWETGVLPRARRSRNQQNTPAPTGESEEPSTVSQTLLNLEAEGKLSSRTPANIEDLRPGELTLPREQMETLKTNLLKGFDAKQLREYLRSKGGRLSGSKRDRVNRIINDIWTIKATEETDHTDSFVPTHTLTLEPELFSLCLGDNGKLLRELAKSGSRIKVDASRSQLHVSAIDSTFRWIQATLLKMKNSLYSRAIDFAHFPEPVSDSQISLIQALTNSHMESTSFPAGSEGVVITCLKRNEFFDTRAYFAQLLPETHVQQNYWYDINPSNIQSCKFRTFADNNALKWMHRLDTWHRWEYESPKITSDPLVFETPEYASLRDPSFSDTTIADQSEESGGIEAVILKSLASDYEQLKNTHKGAEFTLTSTFGQLLSKLDRITKVPDAGMTKLFVTQAPFVSAWASSQAPVYEDKPMSIPSQEGLNDFEKLFELTDEEASGLQKQEEESLPDYSAEQMLQICLKPDLLSPNHEANFTTRVQGDSVSTAPLELWIPFENNKIIADDASALIILEERRHFVSLPEHSVDLKIALIASKPLEITAGIKDYISGCYVDESGTVKAGSTLRLISESSEGAQSEPAFYMLESAHFHSRSETIFNNDTLFSNCITGGVVGGHNTAVELIAESNGGELDQYLERFVKNSIVACDEMSALKLSTQDVN